MAMLEPDGLDTPYSSAPCRMRARLDEGLGSQCPCHWQVLKSSIIQEATKGAVPGGGLVFGLVGWIISCSRGWLVRAINRMRQGIDFPSHPPQFMDSLHIVLSPVSSLQEIMPYLHVGDGRTVSGDFAIARYIARSAGAGGGGTAATALGLLGGSDHVEASLVDQWLDLALTHDVRELAATLDAHLGPRWGLQSFVVAL